MAVYHFLRMKSSVLIYQPILTDLQLTGRQKCVIVYARQNSTLARSSEQAERDKKRDQLTRVNTLRRDKRITTFAWSLSFAPVSPGTC
jgi:hypothetical protein